MSSIAKKLAPYILLIISSIVILGANPFAGETVAPTDILVNQPGWQNLDFDIEVRHASRSDWLDARMPRWIDAKTALRNGEIPIWNPDPINGIPGLQWLPAAIITPAFALFASIEDNATGYYFALLINLIIAATGAYLLLFSMTRNRLAASLGAMIYAYSGFHAAWLFWAHITTSIWIPWLLWLGYQYLTTQRRAYLPWLSIVTALMIFGGFPSVAVYGFLALALLSLFYAPWNSGYKQVTLNSIHLGSALLLGFLITAFAVHSLYEMLQFTQLFETRKGGTPLRQHHIYNYLKPLIADYYNVERTVYLGVIPLLALVLTIPLLLMRKFTLHLGFSLLMLTISVSIAFQFLPKEVITTIPTFSNNNYGRMTVLAALAFALLTAELIAILGRAELSRRYSLLFSTLVLVLIVVQFVDMHWLFRKFNGPVPATTFFPNTPTISHMQNHLKPMQSTIADRSYMVSGVFSNYHIPEWFAHGFKSQIERALMESKLAPNAHRSRTAAAVYCADVYIDSNILNLLAIKYLACHSHISSSGVEKTVLSTSGPKPNASGLITPDQPLIQHFILPEPMQFDIISLKLATHGRIQSHADAALRLYHNDVLVGESIVAASEIHDNTWIDFHFKQLINLDVNNNRLELHTLPTEQTGKLSVWLYPMKADNVYIQHGGNIHDAVFVAKFHRTVSLPDSIRYHHIEDNMVLLENTNITGSGYTLPDLDENLMPDFTQVQLLKSSPTSHELKYTGEQPAWMVLPIRYYPGWQAYVDNEQVAITPFLGMLPAVQVNQGSTVIYRYEPKTLYLLALLSLATLLITLYLAYRFRHH